VVLFFVEHGPLQHVPAVEELPQRMFAVDHRLGAVRDGMIGG
jgi:hypothetical protein